MVPDSAFESAEEYYADHRPGYDDRVFDHLADRFDLDGNARVLDVGCGTGELAVPLAERVGEVVGLDPNGTMLDHARERAARVGVENAEWIVGSDADLSDLDGPFRLVTIGRAFHRMDRDLTLAAVSRLLEPDGGLALVGDAEWLTRGTRAWQDAVYEVAARFLDDLPERTGPVEYDEPYDEMLRARGFQNVERVIFEGKREWTVDDAVGYLFSLSFCAPRRFDDPEAFATALRDRLAVFDPPLVEHVETTVVSGRPPVA